MYNKNYRNKIYKNKINKLNNKYKKYYNLFNRNQYYLLNKIILK